MAFTKIQLGAFKFLAETVYGSNLTDYTMLGGYAVSSTDPVTKIQKYEALKTFSVWTDLNYASFFTYGLFIGDTKNLGSENTIENTYFSRGSNINNIYRVAPRVSYKQNDILVCLEYEFTSAAYGVPDNKGIVQNTTNYNNSRIYTSVYYFF